MREQLANAPQRSQKWAREVAAIYGLTLAEQVTTEGRTLLHTLLRAVDTEALRGLEQGLAALRGAIGHEGP